MTAQIIGTLFVLGVFCLPLNPSRHTNPVPSASPRTSFPSLSEGLLIGDYYLSDLINSRELKLKRNHLFSYQKSGSHGVARRVQGTWELQGDTLILHPEEKASVERLNLRFIPVTWQGRLYLADENQMPTFCVSISPSDPFGDPSHYCRHLSADSKIHIPIPQRFRHFVARGEIVVRVASIDSEGIVTLEGREVSRLQPGMHLCWRNPDSSGKRELRIVETMPGSARAHQVIVPSRYARDAQVRPYELFTTGTYSIRPVGTGKTEN